MSWHTNQRRRACYVQPRRLSFLSLCPFPFRKYSVRFFQYAPTKSFIIFFKELYTCSRYYSRRFRIYRTLVTIPYTYDGRVSLGPDSLPVDFISSHVSSTLRFRNLTLENFGQVSTKSEVADDLNQI